MSPPPLESTPVVATGVPVSDDPRLPALNKVGHAAHCVRCLDGLPASLVEMDASRCVSLSRSFLLFFNPRRFPFFSLQNGDLILLSGHVGRHRFDGAKNIADGSPELERVDMGSICR